MPSSTRKASNGKLKGVIVQFGGQTPLKLAQTLDAHNVPILGTSPDAIDLAEDRDRFKALVDKLKLRQPRNGIAYSIEQALLASEEIGFPIVVRPSYVLGGRAMAILPDQTALKDYFDTTLAAFVSPDIQHRFAGNRHAQVNAVLAKNALLLDSYVRDAIEADVDAICDGKDVFIAGVMEHIEEAGVHSGDSACSLPPHSLCPETLAELERQTAEIARALNVVGLMNVQYAIKGKDVYVLEVNPRASRTVPFVAKVIGHPVASIAARVMAGEKLASFNLTRPHAPACRASRKPFSRSSAFPRSIPFSAPKCGRPARSWASTAATMSPSRRASSRAAAGCRHREPCSFR